MLRLIALLLVALALPSTASAATVPLNGRTFDAAYRQQACGDIITLPASVSAQTIEAPPKTCAAGEFVTFQPATGTTTMPSFRISQGTHIRLRDVTVNGNLYLGCNCATSGQGSAIVQHVELDRVTSRTFIFRSPDNVTWRDGEVGPSSSGAMNWITAGYQSNDPASNILFERVRIHDILADDGQDHTDCIGVDDVDGFTFRDGVIEDCQHFSIIFGGPDSATGRMARNVLVENSVIECCTAGPGSNGPGFYSLAWGGIGGPQVIRNNTLPGASVGFVGLDQNWTNGLLRFEGNTFQRINTAVCPRAIWSGNTFLSGDGCGSGPAPPPPPPPTPTPSPTPTPTPEPTPTPTPEPTPTPTPEPTPEPYSPECAPTCDELVADLRADVAAHEATIAGLTADRDDWQARALDAEDWRERWKARALEAEALNGVAEDKLDRIRAILAE
jgi:hypothetical protein